MPKPRTKAEDIRNPEHYFNRFIACEIKHDQAMRQEIEKNEISLEEKMEHSGFELVIAASGADDVMNAVVAGGPNGWIELLENEHLREALYSLTERQREIVRLYHFEGYKMPEIAELLGLTKSAISRHLSTAMKNLKIFLIGTQLFD